MSWFRCIIQFAQFAQATSLFKPLLIALLIGLSLPLPWLSAFVYCLLWMSAVDAILAIIRRYRDLGRTGQEIQKETRTGINLTLVFGVALVTWTALFAGYPTSAAVYLTGRLAIAVPAFQRN